MTFIGITGHRGMPPPTVRLIDTALREALAEYGDSVTGVTSLADGADQLFARAVLDQGGHIEVIVPPPTIAMASHPTHTQNTMISSITRSGCTGLTSQNRHPSHTWRPAS